MSFALGVFDVFTYAATGSLYVACLIYILNRTGWLPFGELMAVDSTLLLPSLLLLSYLSGHVAYWLGEILDRVLPGRWNRHRQARSRFISRVPGDRARMLAGMHPHLLLAAIELRAPEASHEVSRLRAVGLALRNSAPALLLASVVAAVEVFASPRPMPASIATLLLLGAAWSLVRRGRDLRAWAIMKTLELSYWIPDVGLPATDGHQQVVPQGGATRSEAGS
jgi:hypothetical protein